ncbi:MAG TPA: hypothetical protein DEA28_00305 [Firmicutes bacterium]|nr:hypothetical protein [Bacillota bacterium]
MHQKQTLLYKISFSALFIALTIILSRFFSIPGLFGLPFLKISFSNSIVLFSSFYLGPFWGVVVGGLSDTIGAILFPQGGAYNPIYTIPALLTGLFPYLFYKLFSKSKLDSKFPITLTFLLTIFCLLVSIVFIFNDNIISGKKVYHFDLLMKITIISLSYLLSIIYIVGSYLIKKKFSKTKINSNFNIFCLLSAMFYTYMVIKNPTSSVISSFLLNYDFFFILFIKLLTGFFTCLVHSILVIFLLNVSQMYSYECALLSKYKFVDRRKNEIK